MESKAVAHLFLHSPRSKDSALNITRNTPSSCQTAVKVAQVLISTHVHVQTFTYKHTYKLSLPSSSLLLPFSYFEATIIKNRMHNAYKPFLHP